MEEDNTFRFSADEQSLAFDLEKRLKNVIASIAAFKSIEFQLKPASGGKYRVPSFQIDCSEVKFAELVARVNAQTNVVSQTDDATTKTVQFMCSIPKAARQTTELPADYPQKYMISIQGHSHLNEKDPQPTVLSAETSPDKSKSLTLLLSGGGFRATLFHLGVLSYLRETERLSLVRNVYSVSGGSILAAHLAQKYSDYSGDTGQFGRVAKELIDFTQKGHRESIIRLRILFWISFSFSIVTIVTSLYLVSQYGYVVLALSALALGVAEVVFFRWWGKFTRPINALARAYKTLLGDFKLKDLGSETVKFHLLSTNLTTGNIASFTKGKIIYDAEKTESVIDNAIETDEYAVVNAVAASSAFPPLFSPVELNPKKLDAYQRTLSQSQFLTDGGVFDNLGLRAEKILGGSGERLVVSDAERKFDWTTDESYFMPHLRFSRTTDVLMRRATTLEFEILRTEKAASNACLVRLQDIKDRDNEAVDRHLPSPDLIKRVRRIRTDLDRFTDVEIQLLVASGYMAASDAFEGAARLPDSVTVSDNGMPTSYSGDAWLPFKDKPSLLKSDLRSELGGSESSQRKLWSWKSISCWAGIVLVAATIAQAVFFSWLVSSPFLEAMRQR